MGPILSLESDRPHDRDRLIEKVSRCLTQEDFAEALREIGRYMDKYNQQIPASILEEFTIADRLS